MATATSSPPATGRWPPLAAGRRHRCGTASPRSAPGTGTPSVWSCTTRSEPDHRTTEPSPGRHRAGSVYPGGVPGPLDPKHEGRGGPMDIITCPEDDCGAPAEIVDRWTFGSTDGPLLHLKTRCLRGHCLT